MPAEPNITADGDAEFYGSDWRDARTLAPGMLHEVENCRCTEGPVTTRRGVAKPAWANLADGAGHVRPYGTTYGAGSYQDPNGVQWGLVAADGYVWRLRPGNAPVNVTLPAAVKLLGPCFFVQAFDKVWCFRGRWLAPLKLTSLVTGFEDLLPRWSATPVYANGTEVAYGPFQAVTGITRLGQVATVVTTAPHGYQTGADVVIQGATQTEYNGRFNLTVLDPNTFTVLVSGSPATPATGTITVSNMAQYWKAGGSGGDPAAGDSPDSAPTKWTRIYNVLPNGEAACFANNRLLVATAYQPATVDYQSITGGIVVKCDYLVATDFLDDVHFDFAKEFRINQGSSDEIVDLAKWNENTVVIWKDASWFVLSDLSAPSSDPFDPGLQSVTLDQRGDYGLSARGAWARAGSDLFFLAGKRGVVSVRTTEQGKIIGAEVPLSAPLQPVIDEVDWTAAGRQAADQPGCARLAALSTGEGPSKLFAAVPRRRTQNPNLVPAGAVYVGGSYNLAPLLADGGQYTYGPGPNETVLRRNGMKMTVGFGFQHHAGDTLVLYGAGSVTASVTAKPHPEANNTVLVYDFVAAARAGIVPVPVVGQRSGWAGIDTGSALCVAEFFKLRVNGIERLLYIGADGYVNLVEESWAGDQVPGNGPQGLGWEEIASRARSRTLGRSIAGLTAPFDGRVLLETWDPKYSVEVLFEGVNKKLQGVTDKTRDRTKYIRPWDAAPWDPTNANDDHATADRQDYSVILAAAGVNVGVAGVSLEEWAPNSIGFAIAGKLGRGVQLEVRNQQGRLRVLGMGVASRAGRDRHGTLV